MQMKVKPSFLSLYIMIANIADAYLTDVAVTNGSATELNPLMNYLLGISSGMFYVTKICMISLAVVLMLFIKDKPAAQKTLWAGATIYTLVLLIHCIGLLT